MTDTDGQDGNFWSMGDTVTKTARPAGSKHLFSDAMRAIGMGDAQRAMKSAAAALKLAPADPEINLAMALACEMAGKAADAERYYVTCLKGAPDAVRALIGFGRLKLNARQGVEALKALDRAVKLAPDNIDARHFLARAYGLLLRFDAAVENFEIVTRQRPNDPEILPGYARALAGAGRPAEALEIYRQAGQLDPRNDAVVQGTASVLIEMGDSEEAAVLLRQAIALKPERAGAYEQLARLGELSGPEFDAAVKQAANKALPPLDGASFKLAVGTALVRQAKFAEGFVYLADANAIRDRDRNYQKERVDALVEAVIDAMAELPRRDAAQSFDRPLFIMGMPRSGTTLVEQIFAKHSKVFPGGERAIGSELRRRILVGQPSYRAALRFLSPDMRERLNGFYFGGLPADAATAQRVTDKLPDNIWNLPVIRALFPGARILICKRHPLDTCWSIFEQGFGPQVPYASNLDNIANHLTAQDRVIRKWLAEDVGLSREVLYEELVQHFPQTARDLVTFAGLDWEDACLSFEDSKRAVRTASATQVRQKVHTSAIGRWRTVADQIKPQVDQLAQLVADHDSKLRARGVPLG